MILLLLTCLQLPAEPLPSKAFSISPAAESSPALRVKLLPTIHDKHPGNAATSYLNATLLSPFWATAADRQRVSELAETWKTGPAPELMFRLLRDSQRAIREANYAARCDACDWGLLSRSRNQILATPADVLNPMRELSTTINWQIQDHIIAKRYADAATALQTNLQLARDMQSSPLILTSLISRQTIDYSLDRIDQWISTPDSPNLYWALARLPKPFLDLRACIEFESEAFPKSILPEFVKLEQGPVTNEEVDRLLGRVGLNDPEKPAPGMLKKVGLDHSYVQIRRAAQMTTRYAPARRWLLAHGKLPAEIDAMPTAQVVYLYDLALMRELRDDYCKWFGQPYPLAMAGVNRVAEKEKRLKLEADDDPILTMLLSTIPNLRVHIALSGLVDRRIAMLQVVEAIRIHLGLKRKLPDNLQEIVSVPIPDDPLTGQPFRYSLKESTFILEAVTPPGEKPGKLNRLRLLVSTNQ